MSPTRGSASRRRTWRPPCCWTGRTSRSSTSSWAVRPARCGWACGSGRCGATRGRSATSRRPASRTRPTRATRGSFDLAGGRGRVRADAVPGAPGRHHQRRGDAGADLRRGVPGHRADQGRHRVLVLGVLGLPGRAGSFVQAVDAIGAVPPTMESHVEMDAAWALYEAWVKVLTGEAEVALAYGFGKSSGAQLRRVLALQLDPYLLAPLWPDSVSIAGLQARLGLDAGLWTEKDMAAVAARSRGAALGNPAAQVSEEVAVSELLARPYVAEPLRAHDCAPVGDGAAVVIIASQARARELCARPAWITGFAHRIDSGSLGARDLLAVPSATGALSACAAAAAGSACAAAAAGRAAEVSAVDVAELHAPFTHQEILLREALRLGDEVEVNPSGGALCGNPMFAAGLARIGMAAQAIMTGRAGRALGHATSGPALQQNLVCLMEAQ